MYEPKSLIPNKPMNSIKSITATASVIMANVAHPDMCKDEYSLALWLGVHH